MKFSTMVYVIVYGLLLCIIVFVCVDKELTTDPIFGVKMLKHYCHPFHNNGHETDIVETTFI